MAGPSDNVDKPTLRQRLDRGSGGVAGEEAIMQDPLQLHKVRRLGVQRRVVTHVSNCG